MKHLLAASLLTSFAMTSRAHADDAPPPAPATVTITYTGTLESTAALRARLAEQVAAANAEVEEALSPPLPPPGSWSLGVRFPWDVTSGAGNTGIGLLGVGVDLDNRVSDHWYLGASGDLEWMMDIGTSASGLGTVNNVLRVRAGVDARYNFHDGTSTVSPKWGPSFDVRRHDWIGARAGLETLDGGSNFGQFAELSLGMDRQLGKTQIGPYISAGVSLEPTQAYGTTATMAPPGAAAAVTEPASSSIRSTYFTLGLRLVLG